MLRIAYISSLAEGFSDQALLNIQFGAKRNNEKQGITSVLIIMKGLVFQLIEGAEESVIALMDEIYKDIRHINISTVLKQNTKDRLFGAPIYMLGQHTARRLGVQQKIYSECSNALQLQTQSDASRFELIFGAVINSTMAVSATAVELTLPPYENTPSL